MKDCKQCILVADDDNEIRQILQLLLTSQGYSVLTADDGLSAERQASETWSILPMPGC